MMSSTSNTTSTSSTSNSSSNTDSDTHSNIKKPSKVPQWREAVAGACSGAISRTILAPIERIKLLQQLQSSSNYNYIQHTGNYDIQKLSSMQLVHKIYTEEGLIAFWRGNLPNVLRVAGTQALNFTCMDYYKRAAVIPIMDTIFLQQQQQQDSKVYNYKYNRRKRIVTSFISGGLAGATATTILYPMEFVRTRLAMDRGRTTTTVQNQYRSRQYTGMMDVLRRIVQSDGIFGFYQGYGVALVGGILYRILHLGGYDACKTELLLWKTNNQLVHQQQQQQSRIEERVELSWSERFFIAQLISLLAGTMVYPFDSVRRRMMMQAGVLLQDRKYTNSIHCTRMVWNTEGVRGFYLGIGPNLLRSVGGALILVGYDSIKLLL